ncbi:MAG: phosphopantetheine-binding protein [bacterium]|nr:phosphopantetheine-binding protein [bacterium]
MAINVEQEVKNMLAKITDTSVDKITLETDLVNDLEIDSLKIIEIATEIEKTFKVSISDAEMVTIRKVSDAVTILQKLLTEKA